MYSVYKIVCHCCQGVYVGSTKASLHNRLQRHIYSARRGSGSSLHQHIRTIKDGTLTISLLCPSTTITDARMLENQWICELDSKNNGFNDRYESPTCEHNCFRIKCTPCGGSQSRCKEHNTVRYQCNKGNCRAQAKNICTHGTQRAQCSICDPYKCDWCDTTLTRSGYKSHIASHKHNEELTPSLDWLFR